MSDNKEKKMTFTYPEGFIEAANSLTFLPDEESRKQFVTAFISRIIMM